MVAECLSIFVDHGGTMFCGFSLILVEEYLSILLTMLEECCLSIFVYNGIIIFVDFR